MLVSEEIGQAYRAQNAIVDQFPPSPLSTCGSTCFPRPKAANPSVTPTNTSGGTIDHFPRPPSSGSLCSAEEIGRSSSFVAPTHANVGTIDHFPRPTVAPLTNWSSIDHFPRPSSRGSCRSTGTLILSNRSVGRDPDEFCRSPTGEIVRSNSDLSTSASSGSTSVRPRTPCGPRPKFRPSSLLPAFSTGKLPPAMAAVSNALEVEDLLERPETRLHRMTRYAARPRSRVTQERRRQVIKEPQEARRHSKEELKDEREEKDSISGWGMGKFMNMANSFAREASSAPPPLGRSASLPNTSSHGAAQHQCEAASWGWGVRPLTRRRGTPEAQCQNQRLPFA